MDTIADLLSIIKNGYSSKKKEVSAPYSKVSESLAKILVEEGYLESVTSKQTETKNKKILILKLKYAGKKPSMVDVKRISKPGLRVYKGKLNLPKVLGGLGVTVVSTSQGLMPDREARKKALGGEIICKVW